MVIFKDGLRVFDVAKTVCHQVLNIERDLVGGSFGRGLLEEAFGLPPAGDEKLSVDRWCTISFFSLLS